MSGPHDDPAGAGAPPEPGAGRSLVVTCGGGPARSGRAGWRPVGVTRRRSAPAGAGWRGAVMRRPDAGGTNSPRRSLPAWEPVGDCPPREGAVVGSREVRRVAMASTDAETGKVVVGTDGSAGAATAADWAVGEARRRQTGVHLLAAIPWPAYVRAYDVTAPEGLLSAGERLAEEAAERLRRDHPDIPVTAAAVLGDPPPNRPRLFPGGARRRRRPRAGPAHRHPGRVRVPEGRRARRRAGRRRPRWAGGAGRAGRRRRGPRRRRRGGHAVRGGRRAPAGHERPPGPRHPARRGDRPDQRRRTGACWARRTGAPTRAPRNSCGVAAALPRRPGRACTSRRSHPSRRWCGRPRTPPCS